MYTGGIENHVAIISRVSAQRILWGNGPQGVRAARSPSALWELLTAAGLRCPEYRFAEPENASATRWLVKPRLGSGGRGIRWWNGEEIIQRGSRRQYLQEHMEGTSCSAVYVGTPDGAQLLGVTRQLVGETWLHALPFHYCGSVGPLRLAASVEDELERIGEVFARAASLRGLFGVDFILREDAAYPVEVNPRYTASVEVLELALGISAIAQHRLVFDRLLQPVVGVSRARPAFIGKGILFAKGDGRFPADGPWMEELRDPGPVWEEPAFADIPEPGTRYRRGHPIMTLLSTGDSEADCVRGLRRAARDLDRSLGGE